MKRRASRIAMYITVCPPSYSLLPFELLYFIIIYIIILLYCVLLQAGPDRRAHTCLLRRVAQLHCRQYRHIIQRRVYIIMHIIIIISYAQGCALIVGARQIDRIAHILSLYYYCYLLFFRAALLLGGRHAPPTPRRVVAATAAMMAGESSPRVSIRLSL